MSIVARKTIVSIGHLLVDGYLLPNGKFGMSQTQVILLSGVTTDTHHAASRYTDISRSKQAKTLVPQGFVVHRNLPVVGEIEKINLVELDSVSPFLTVCLSLGHIEAAKPLALLSGLSLQQLFCDAFGLKFEAEERQAWLLARTESKDFFFEFTTEISSWFNRTKADRTQPIERYMSMSFDAINRGLFGKTSKQIRIELGVSDVVLIRDYFNNESLRRISQVQSISGGQMRKNLSLRPLDAAKFALDCSCFDVIDFKSEDSK